MTPSCVPISRSSAESIARAVQVHDFLGRAGDDIRAPQLDGLGHPAPAVVEDAAVLGPLRRDPAVKRDHADDLEARVGQRSFQLGETSPLLEIGRDLVVPGLDRLVAGLAGDLDLLQQGRRPDRAGVETVDETRSWWSLSSQPAFQARNRSRLRSVRALRCVARTGVGCDRVDRPCRHRRRSAGRHQGRGSRH